MGFPATETSAWPAPPLPVVTPRALPAQPQLPRTKVLHVITRFYAGAGLNTLLTALGTDPDRYEVWVAGVPGDDLWERAEAGGIRTVQIPGFREVLTPADAVVLWQLVRLIRRERFTIVHTHCAKGGFLGRLAARLAGVPVVVHTFHAISFHDHMPRWRRVLYRTLERRARRLADAYIAVAPRLATEAIEQRLAPPGRVEAVPSALDLASIPEDFDPDCRRALGVPEDITLIGTVGRIVPQKAPLDFVRMAALVHARHPDTAFVIVGDGPLADDVRGLAAALGVDVRITGWRSDAARLAAGLDVFVFSSLYEGLGRGLSEALAAARPAVATAVNGVPDLMAPGATGLLVAPSDPENLARAVGWLLDHPVEAAEMGRRGRARVREGFSQDIMCSAIESCYRRLLAVPEPRPTPGS
ncbi:D-inositol-3-phosphate glycosyltransferase [Streptomyces sp. enrichment culture]